MNTMTEVRFWNGNKSSIRQSYELELLRLVLQYSDDFCGAALVNDITDYPDAEEEGAIFSKGIDLCVTVAGNLKFKQNSFIPIEFPLMSGLLGHRLLIIRESDIDRFASIRTLSQLQNMVFGIPATWADAHLFRENSCRVDEEGALEDVFQRLQDGRCDYLALGANEIHSICKEMADLIPGLTIESRLRLYYPLALVFYIHPEQHFLAKAVTQGLERLIASGRYESYLADFCRLLMHNINLSERFEIQLHNPLLPTSMYQTMVEAKTSLLKMTSKL